MNPITDLLSYSRKLKEAGESEKIAEMHAEMLGKIIEENLASKDDIKTLGRSTDERIQTLEHKIDKLDSKLNWLIALISIFGAIIALGNNLTTFLHNIKLI